MTARTVHPDHLVYIPGFLDADRNARLTEHLEGTPTVGGSHPLGTFAFVAPQVDGTTVAGRREAAAGWPVWDGQGPTRGPSLPEPLADLAEDVTRAFAALGDGDLAPTPETIAFTSVYVDRYPVGGGFVPHTDRGFYGPTVAGVSVGTGSCLLTFRTGTRPVAEVELEPGSLYGFCGSLRRTPFTHEVGEVDGLRYGITFRTPAAVAVGSVG